MKNSKVKALAKTMLSAKRYRHEKAVVAAAKRLARRYGASVKKAELAGWLHDIVKERPPEELLQLLQQDAIMAGQTAQRPATVWHGPCAAIFARHTLGIQDTEVLSAVACHTTGKENMALLDKVLLVADMISKDRKYTGVEELRSLAKANLDAAVIETLRRTVEYVRRRGLALDEETARALESMEAQQKKAGR